METDLKTRGKIVEWRPAASSAQRALVIFPSGPAAGVSVWLHAATGQPEDLVKEARAYPDHISVIPDLPYSVLRRAGAPRGPADGVAEAKIWRQSVWELSRLLDWLESDFIFSLERSFAVGFNLGGSVLARWVAEDMRIQNIVVTGSVPELSRFWMESAHAAAVRSRELHAESLRAYSERTREFDLVESVARLENVRALFQFGRDDDWIDAVSVQRLGARLESRHDIKWHSDDHDMRASETEDHRRAWLQRANIDAAPG